MATPSRSSPSNRADSPHDRGSSPSNRAGPQGKGGNPNYPQGKVVAQHDRYGIAGPYAHGVESARDAIGPSKHLFACALARTTDDQSPSHSFAFLQHPGGYTGPGLTELRRVVGKRRTDKARSNTSRPSTHSTGTRTTRTTTTQKSAHPDPTPRRHLDSWSGRGIDCHQSTSRF